MAGFGLDTPDMLRSYNDGMFITMCRDIYAARLYPNAPPPKAFENDLFTNLIPEIQNFVASYDPYESNPSANIYLTRNGANGNSLRRLAMMYKPSGLRFFLEVTPDTAGLMYHFYGKSHVEIGTSGPVPIDVNRFHEEVASITIVSSDNQDIVLQDVAEQMRSRKSLKYHFMTLGNNASSIRARSPADLKAIMRGFLRTGFERMVSSPSPELSIEVSFALPFPEERDDSDPHEYLALLSGQTYEYTSVVDNEFSIIQKPATDTIPGRYLIYKSSENTATLQIHTRPNNNEN